MGGLQPERIGRWEVYVAGFPDFRSKQQLSAAQVRFVVWTAEDQLRHAAFLGLRTDKRPKEVRREG